MDFQFLFNLKMGAFLLAHGELEQLVPKAWRAILDLNLLKDIESKLNKTFLPKIESVFLALQLPPDQVKVVIVGQDPYPNPKHAMGLAFSVKQDTSPLPASLKNIFLELESDLGYKRINGDLSDWSEQGVLLLNRTLTVAPSQSNSHSKFGWNNFTNSIIEHVGRNDAIGVLWGKQALLLSEFFNKDYLITSAHPSPLSAYRGFFGSKPFTKINFLLEKKGLLPIKW